MRSLLSGLLAVAFLATPCRSQFVEDVHLAYEATRITDARLTGADADLHVLRQVWSFAAGRGPLALGFQYRFATEYVAATHAPEDGIMLTADWSAPLGDRLTLSTFGRLAVTESDLTNPLYGADTDLLAKLVLSEPDGVSSFAGDLFPSGYLGAKVNRQGRAQLLAGAGVWARGVGAYLTLHHAVNGVSDLSEPGGRADELFAVIRNSGLSGSLSYSLGEVEIGLRKNVAFRNGGNDFALSLSYRVFLLPG